MHNELLNPPPYHSAERESFEPPSQTILLVDDDPDIRSLVRTFLEHEGYRVYSCGSADRAKQIFQNNHPHGGIHLLITDFYMPGQSGMQLAQELRLQQERLAVLLISGGFLDSTDLEEMRQANWRLLSKPFALPDLLTAVHRMLGNGEAAVGPSM